jgi:FkbM family methyltransferase
MHRSSEESAGGEMPVRRPVPTTRRSARLALLEAAFVNWRTPGYLGSAAYRARRFSPRTFERLMDIRLHLKTRSGPKLLARLRDVNGPAEVFGVDEYATPWLDWSQVEYVIDAGAHVGGFSLWAAARSPCRILAIEPNPATRELLETNVRRSHLGARVAVIASALAGTRGLGRLRPASDSAATALVRDGVEGDVVVETLDLADAIEVSGFPRVDVLMMDVEGAEHEVMASAGVETLHRVGLWFVECHPVPGTVPGAIAERLREAGFEVAALSKPQGQELLIARRSS